MVTLKDLARECNVSVSTASRAFDKSSRISLPVRQRILDCAATMGYSPNLIARSLKNKRTMTVALIIPTIDNRFYIDVLKHLEIQLHQYGYRLLVSFVQPGITTEQECLEMMVATKADGIILIPDDTTSEDFIMGLSHIQFIQLFNRPYSQIDSIVMDDNGGAEAGTNYLLAHNHRRILFAGGNNRREGIRRALACAGIGEDEVCMLPDLSSVEDICRAVQDFRPTAIFSVGATNEAVWTALRQMKLSVPADISLLVYDNTQWVRLVDCTAIGHNLEQIASALVQQLLHRLNSDDAAPARHIVLDPFIIERSSIQALEE